VNTAKRLQQLEQTIARLVDDQSPAKVRELSLLEFLREGWHVLEPTPFCEGLHHRVMAAWLEAMALGDVKKCVISVPPRHTKSLMCSMFFPAWCWTKWPALRFMFTSYSADLSDEFSVKRRMLIESQWYQQHWGKLFHLRVDQNQAKHFANDRGGVMISTSMGGSATGRGGDFLIVDDAHSAKKVESDVERKTTIRDFKSVFSTRLNNRRTGRILCIGQRLHTDDLPGHLLEAGYQHVFLPAVADDKVTLILPSGRTTERTNVLTLPDGCTITRPVGGLLWPSREGPAEIEAAKRELGPGYTGQYQQQPSPAGGAKFKKEWFKYFTMIGRYVILHRTSGDEKHDLDGCTTFQTVDVAMSLKTHADFTVILTAAVTTDGDLLILHVNRGRYEAPDLLRELKDARTYWSPQFQAVEKQTYGMAICQQLRREGVSLLELDADKDKLSRSTTASIQMQGGKIFFPDDAVWLGDFENELLTFPASVHDDQVDTLAYAALVQQTQYMNASAMEAGVSLGPEFRSVFAGGVLPVGKYGY